MNTTSFACIDPCCKTRRGILGGMLALGGASLLGARGRTDTEPCERTHGQVIDPRMVRGKDRVRKRSQATPRRAFLVIQVVIGDECQVAR